MRRRAVIAVGAAGFVVLATETRLARRVAALDAERDAFHRLMAAGAQDGSTCPVCGSPLRTPYGEVAP